LLPEKLLGFELLYQIGGRHALLTACGAIHSEKECGQNDEVCKSIVIDTSASHANKFT
jgi:hypothetical protein